MKKNIKTLAALLIASATFVACSSDNDIIGENQQPVNPTGKYTMTINASKGDGATTRALSLDGKTLKVKWADTDKVSVFPAASNGTLLGTLTAAASETGTTTLTGDLTGTVNVNDNLSLLFPRGEWDYTGQKGILLSDENSIEKKYDYALADVTVAAIDNSHITTTANANFASQQAIVKFILKDKANNAAINANKLTISAASNKLVTKKTLVGIGDKIYHSGYTVTAGSGGFNDNESHTKLVDGDLSTKWCANNGHKSEGVWYIEFNTDSPIKVDGYMLRTGGDTGDGDNWQRNPKSWVLKGKENSGGAWTSIDAKSDYTEMPHASNAEKDFNASNPGTYQYFRLEISATGGDLMQLSEMKLFTTATEPTEINSYGPIVVTPASATSELTVALRNENASADTYNLTAVVDGIAYSIAYTLEKSGITFENGKYYEITAKLTKQTTIDLSTVTTDMTIPDGFTLTGTLAEGVNVKISIADGATVTLDGVTINGANNDSYQWAGITCLGDATIILKDGTENTVKGFQWDYPGIYVPVDKTLTIQGSGSLTASSNGGGCGIGGGNNIACGNIVIAGGTITATGGNAAGIGSGYNQSSCGTISITGGNITANGGSGAAGIGSGQQNECGTISITGGNITANGGNGAAGIGGGRQSSCGNISITGGTINATGGMAGAGIGSGGYQGSCGTISITGGTINATGGYAGAGIGGGLQGSCGTVTITNGVTSVTATKGDDANHSIGRGAGNSSCGTVTIGGTKYWENNAAVGDGATYLAQDQIVYQP